MTFGRSARPRKTSQANWWKTETCMVAMNEWHSKNCQLCKVTIVSKLSVCRPMWLMVLLCSVRPPTLNKNWPLLHLFLCEWQPTRWLCPELCLAQIGRFPGVRISQSWGMHIVHPNCFSAKIKKCPQMLIKLKSTM